MLRLSKNSVNCLGAVMAVDWLPDGKRVVTASWDNTAKLWDAEQSTVIQTLTGLYFCLYCFVVELCCLDYFIDYILVYVMLSSCKIYMSYLEQNLRKCQVLRTLSVSLLSATVACRPQASSLTCKNIFFRS